jgi:hypothetical protein
MAHTTIHVTFVEGATGRILGRTDIPIDQLPASFETATTLHIGNQDWHVDKAEPARAEGFGHTGALTLTLSRVAYMDPRNILFTLPTLDAAIPHPDERISASGPGVLELHEDDWRQIEFVSAKYQREIEAELADIAAIFREHSVDNGRFLGFREIHMRKRIPSPLDPPIALQHVWAALGVPGAEVAVVAFERTPGIVPASFAFRVGGLTVYGASEANRLQCLCIHRHDASLREPTLSSLQRMMSAHRLYLVDWCRMVVLAPDDAASLTRYLSGQ